MAQKNSHVHNTWQQFQFTLKFSMPSTNSWIQHIQVLIVAISFYQTRSSRTSGRIATNRIKEMERRQREEAEALEEYKKAKKKEAEREKKKLEKLKQQGKDKEYKEKMAQAKRKRKYDSEEESSEEDDDEDDYKVLFLTLASFFRPSFPYTCFFLSVFEACSRFYMSLFFCSSINS